MSKSTSIAVEQRHCERTLYPDLRIICNGLATSSDTRPPDLSPEGMFVNTPCAVMPGAMLQVRFDLVCTGSVVEAQGKVRYWIPGVGVGLQFVDLPATCRAAIEQELDWKKTGRRVRLSRTAQDGD